MNLKKYLVVLFLIGGGLSIKLNAQQLLSVEKREKLSLEALSSSPLLEMAKLEKAGSLDENKFEALLEQFKENCGWSDSSSDDGKQDSLALSTDSGAQLSPIKLTQSSEVQLQLVQSNQSVSPIHIASSASKKNKSKKPVASSSNEVRPGNDFDMSWSLLKNVKLNNKTKEEVQEYQQKLNLLINSADEVVTAGKVLPLDVKNTLEIIKKSLKEVEKQLKVFNREEQEKRAAEEQKMRNIGKAQHGLRFALDTMNSSKILSVTNPAINMSSEESKGIIKKAGKIIEELERLQKVSPDLFEQKDIKDTKKVFFNVYNDAANFIFFDQPTSIFMNDYIEFLHYFNSLSIFYIDTYRRRVSNDSPGKEFIEFRKQMVANCNFLRVKIVKLNSELKLVLSSTIKINIENQLSIVENAIVFALRHLNECHDKKFMKKGVKCEDCKKANCCALSSGPAFSFKDSLTENARAKSKAFVDSENFIKKHGYLSPQLLCQSIKNKLNDLADSIKSVSVYLNVPVVSSQESNILATLVTHAQQVGKVCQEINELVSGINDNEDDKSDIDPEFYQDFFTDDEQEDDEPEEEYVNWQAVAEFKAKQNQDNNLKEVQKQSEEKSDDESSTVDTLEETE